MQPATAYVMIEKIPGVAAGRFMKETGEKTMDLAQAKQMLAEQDLTCIIFREDVIYSSSQRGVKPLLALIDTDKDCRDFSAVDKVVGKAAAFLYVLMGIRELHAGVISEQALRVLKEHEVQVTYDRLAAYIVNRAGDGRCPMETAVWDIGDCQEALEAVRRKVRELAQKGDAK